MTDTEEIKFTMYDTPKRMCPFLHIIPSIFRKCNLCAINCNFDAIQKLQDKFKIRVLSYKLNGKCKIMCKEGHISEIDYDIMTLYNGKIVICDECRKSFDVFNNLDTDDDNDFADLSSPIDEHHFSYNDDDLNNLVQQLEIEKSMNKNNSNVDFHDEEKKNDTQHLAEFDDNPISQFFKSLPDEGGDLRIKLGMCNKTPTPTSSSAEHKFKESFDNDDDFIKFAEQHPKTPTKKDFNVNITPTFNSDVEFIKCIDDIHLRTETSRNIKCDDEF
jgi:hypothetical protein